MMIWPKAPPKPKEDASQANPKPAASPPNMAPHGRLGATAAAAAGAPGRAAAALLLAGAAGAASRRVTLDDCLPTELPPPKRLASASAAPKLKVSASMAEKTIDQIFMMSP